LTEEHDVMVALRYDIVRILRGLVTMPEDAAAAAAERMMHVLRARRGGLYISRRDAMRVRDSHVRREFDGRNRVEICRRYSISRATFYRIITDAGRKSHNREK